MEIPRPFFTKENANFLRFMSLVNDIGGDVLREMLKEYWETAGSTLELFLGTTYTKYQMQILLNKSIITQKHHDLLYPSNSVPPDLNSFDITLLFTLLRNLHPKLKTGNPVWTSPNDSDLSREADIRRVTEFRNTLSHSITTSMSNVDFAANWTNLETVLHRLVQNHRIETDIKRRIVTLKTASHSLHTDPARDRMTDCEELIRRAIEQETLRPSHGLTIAHWAAFSGRVSLMKRLVDNKDHYGVDIQQPTYDGKNAMHIACEGGHDEMLFYLFKEFPDMLHEADYSGRLPWHWAAYGGNLQLMEFFCKMKRAFDINLLGTDYNGRNVIFYAALGGQGTIFTFLRDTFPQLLKGTDDCGFTIGHYAVYGGEVKIMETLLQAKEENAFDLSERSDSGMSLLHTACLGGSLSMFELLASHGDQNLFDRTDDEGKSVAHWAATGGNVSIMKYLQRNHADSLTSLTGSGQTILHEACAAGKEEMCDYILSIHADMLNASDDGGNTAAHWVAFGGNVDLIKKLSDRNDNKKVDILRKTSNGESILHKACASGNTAMFDFVRSLPNGLQQENDDRDYTILHWAAVGGCLKIMETVLDSIENKEIVNKITNDGQNVLHVAAAAGKEQVFDFLCSNYPALITGRDDNDNTVAHSAVRGGNRKILQRLINLHDERKIDLNDINEMGQTIMHVACMSGTKICFDILLKTVPDMINKIDWGGCNVFHWAAYAGNIQLMKTLQKHSVESKTCKVNIEDKTYVGASVLHFACLSGREKMFHYIVSDYEYMLTSIDNGGFTMAHWASFGGNVTILRFLEDSGKINLNQTSNTNLSILHAACVNSKNVLKQTRNIEPQRNSIQNLLSDVNITSIKNLGVQRFLGDFERDEVSFDTLSMVLPERIIEQNFSHVSYKLRKKQMFDFIVQRYNHMLCEKDIIGRGVCHLAAMTGNQLLLEHINELMKDRKPNFIEKTTDGMTVLHYACLSGDFVTFQFVLRLFPQLQSEHDYQGHSVIHWAAYGGNVKIMKYLFNLFLEDDFLVTTNQNLSIIDLACMFGKRTMFGLLIGSFPYLLHINDGHGIGPACWAAYGGNVKIMYCLKTLHEKGTIDILQTTDSGLTLLHWACLGGKLSVAEFILNSFPNFLSATDSLQRTTMHRAAFSGNIDLMSFLMKQDQELKLNLFKMKEHEGRSILDYVCEGGHKAMFDLIINTYPDLINGHDDYGANAAHWAAKGGNVQIMESLHNFHKNGIINILRTTKRRQTIIDIACEAGKLQMFRYLSRLFSGLIVDHDRIHTAMVWTAVGGNVQIMEELIALQKQKAGTITYDTNVFLSVGQSCLYLASLHANYDMFSIVLKHFPVPDILRRRYSLRLFFEILRGKFGEEFKNGKFKVTETYNIVHFIAHGGSVRIAEALKNTVVENDYIVNDAIGPNTDVPAMVDMCSKFQNSVALVEQHFDILFGKIARILVTASEKVVTAPVVTDSPEKYEEEMCETPVETISIKGSRQAICEPSGETIRSIASNNNATIECFRTRTVFQENMLHIASRMSHCTMFDYLVQKFPDMLQHRNLLGHTTGHIAVEGESKYIIKRLFEFHWEGKLDLSTRDHFGQTILLAAATSGNTSMFTYIYKQLPGLIKVKDNNGNTAAHWAAFSGNIGIIRFLLEKSTDSGEVIYRRTAVPCSDIFSPTNDGKHLLHCAVLGRKKVCFDFVAKQFPGMLTECDKEGKSVVHYAAQYAGLDMVEFILDGHYATRVSTRQKTNNGKTILHCAAFNKQQEVFDYLIQSVPEMLTECDDEGKTVFHYLAENGGADRLRNLIEEGHATSVNLKKRTRKGMTILHLACEGGHRRIFDYIIEKVPELMNMNDYSGRTVTYWAHQGCNNGIIRKVSKLFRDLAPSLD